MNAALCAAASSADAEIVGRIGDDAGGRLVEAELAARGIRSSLAIDTDRPTGTFLMVDGEVRVDRGANAAFLPQHLPAALEANVTLVSAHLPEETVTAALERSSATWNALAVARLTRLPDGGNAAFMNEDEARVLTGTDPSDAARQLGQRYRLVCVTLGAMGAVGVLDGRPESAAAPARPAWQERPGSGDAFAAAVLVALAAGASFRDALARGCRAGSLAAG